MPNKFYHHGGERAARVEALFSAIARRYDLINDLQSFGLHRRWKRRLLALAQIQPGDRVLDLCCGTGDVSLQFVRAGAHVVGLDFNDRMLQIARQRSTLGSQDLLWVRGDALDLPFAEAQFDAVTISYGLRNLASFKAGLDEMWRVTKPGGRLLVLDFGRPRHPWLRGAYFFYLKHWVPLFGRLFCGDASMYSYIYESLQHYPAQDGIAGMMRDLRCTGTGVLNLLGGMMSINYGRKAAD